MVDLTLIGIFGLGMLGSCIQSVMAPFLPGEAKENNVSDAIVGSIFSIQPLTAAFFSPIIGMFLAKMGRKRVLLLSGLLLV